MGKVPTTGNYSHEKAVEAENDDSHAEATQKDVRLYAPSQPLRQLLTTTKVRYILRLLLINAGHKKFLR